MAANKTTAERIETQRARMGQMENELKRLLNQQKAEERKARTHRICQRGGLIESLLPDTITLNAEWFRVFLEKTVANDTGRRTLAALKAEQEKGDAISNAGVSAEDEQITASKLMPVTPNNGEVIAPKPAEPAQSGGAASAAREREVMRPGA
jgi:hypothetical protein